MGLTVLEMEVGNPANPPLNEKLEFLIDSGAVDSVVPEPVMDRLGIKPLSEQTFRLADGSKITRRRGGVLFKYEDKVSVADVIFGEEGDSTLLGVHALESLALDPIRRELQAFADDTRGNGGVRESGVAGLTRNQNAFLRGVSGDDAPWPNAAWAEGNIVTIRRLVRSREVARNTRHSSSSVLRAYRSGHDCQSCTERSPRKGDGS